MRRSSPARPLSPCGVAAAEPICGSSSMARLMNSLRIAGKSSISTASRCCCSRCIPHSAVMPSALVTVPWFGTMDSGRPRNRLSNDHLSGTKALDLRTGGFSCIAGFTAQRVVATVADLLSQSIDCDGDRHENHYLGSPILFYPAGGFHWITSKNKKLFVIMKTFCKR